MNYINSLVRTLNRSVCNHLSRRPFHLSRVVADANSDEVKLNDPFCLDPIFSPNYTIKEHDNCRRQKIYEFGLYVAACMPKYVQKVQIQHNDEVELCCCPEGQFPVLSFLRYHQHACFEVLSCATAMDVPSRCYRFEVVYNLLSMRFSERIRFKTYTDEMTPIHSAYELYKVANFFEREIYDLYGVIFSHHPDLRRILTDYGFQGHPLRKDFPITGFMEVRYDDELKKIVYEPLEYAQEYKTFQLNSPWTYARNFHEEFNSPAPKPQ